MKQLALIARIALMTMTVALPLAAQNTNVTVTFSIPTTALQDVLAWNRVQITAQSAQAAAHTTASMGTSDTTFTLTSAAGYTATDFLSSAVATLYIDNEAISCTVLTGAVYSSCTRGQFSTTAATHASGTAVYQTLYATNASLLKAVLAPGLIQIITGLGSSSAYLGTNYASQATAAANIMNAIALGSVVK